MSQASATADLPPGALAVEHLHDEVPRLAAGAWPARRKLEHSLKDINKAIARDPGSADLHFLQASALLSMGNEEGARHSYLAALRCDPDHLGALTGLGRQLTASRHRGAARMLLERAVARHPGDVASRVGLGTLLYESGEPAAAREAFAEALRIAPDSAEAHAGMSFALARLGEDALAALHRHEGFARRSVIELPYRGADAPVDVLMLASASGANAPMERFLDDRIFRTRLVVAEFHDPRAPLPPHHLVVNAIGDADADPRALRAAQDLLAGTHAPLINAPAAIAPTGRCQNWRRLAGLPGVVTPSAQTLARAVLGGAQAPATLRAHGLEFPLLLRAPGHHTGEHFVLVPDARALPGLVQTLPGAELIAMQFVDTRDAHGKTRKYRVMMIDGALYPLHLAVARHWKVHYFSADMRDDVAHRAEDAAFLADMPGVLGARAMDALRRIQECLGLDYGGIDFGLDAHGDVVVFEANASMVVYQPDADPRWNYRRAAVSRIQSAVRRMLLARVSAPLPPAAHAPHPQSGRGLETAPRVPGQNSALAAPALRGREPGPRAAPAPGLNALNFSSGPGALPACVLQRAQEAVIALPETGISVLGMSHRSDWFEGLLDEAEANIRQLLAVPAAHAVVFLQGGSSLQFSMVPMNFAAAPRAAPAHVRSGYWSARAIDEARCVRPVEIAWSGDGDGYRRLPAPGELATAAHAPYLHYVANETVEGLQFARAPSTQGVPLVADMSSDLLSRPVDFSRHAMVYAHAQKNLGPAGVTVCIIEHALLERVPDGLPPMLDYRVHLRHGSNYNTPPVFGIYVLVLVTRWLRDEIGGIAAMQALNQSKAAQLYRTLDGLAPLVRTHAEPAHRSLMNASFRFLDPRLDAMFLAQASQAGFVGLAGHRALGGLRASLYNAVTESAVTQLCDLLRDFAARHG